jgi:hypothetical protein
MYMYKGFVVCSLLFAGRLLLLAGDVGRQVTGCSFESMGWV